jgi:hypothetical protein
MSGSMALVAEVRRTAAVMLVQQGDVTTGITLGNCQLWSLSSMTWPHRCFESPRSPEILVEMANMMNGHGRRSPRSRRARLVRRRFAVSPLFLGSILSLAVAVVVGGVVIGLHLKSSSATGGASMNPTPTTVAPQQSSSSHTPDGPPHDVHEQLAAEFAGLAAELNAQVGLVIRAVGNGPGPVIVDGEWSRGPAWSTIKVPLAIAALRKSNPPEVTEAMRAAITQSDNAAAEAIWQSLGDPSAAALETQKVLELAGDSITVVESQRVRPEFSAFGQTEWTLTGQAQFLSSAICDSAAEPVMSLMRQIEAGQSWGLGTIEGAQFKGGWGPSLDGTYLVRQMGVVPAEDGGLTAVAVAVLPASGAFDDGTQALTRIANWLNEHVELLPSGHCF